MTDTGATSAADIQPPAKSASPVTLRQLLLVPAIIVPLYTAVPAWFDKGVAFWKDLRTVDAAKAEEQVRLASLNMNCLNAPYRYFQSDSKLNIDGTICKTGDVLVRVSNERHEGAIYWVSSDELKARIAYSRSQIAAPQTAAADLPPAVAPAAWRSGTTAGYVHQAVATDSWPQPRNPYFQLTQGTVTVICTTRIDDRHVRQRIRRPDGCFDQVIDLANGAVVSSTSAPCSC